MKRKDVSFPLCPSVPSVVKVFRSLLTLISHHRIVKDLRLLFPPEGQNISGQWPVRGSSWLSAAGTGVGCSCVCLRGPRLKPYD